MERIDGRRADELRPVTLIRSFTKYAEGSVLITMGDTRVLCTASVENGVPPFLRGTGRGWVTAEYGMLPRSTPVRTPRDGTKGRQAGRSQEIQRLIGRCLRSVTDLAALGEKTVWIDCDVIQADGGTRTASVTGAFVALADALEHLRRQGDLGGPGGAAPRLPLTDFLAAVSVGVVDGDPLLDLNFHEDSRAKVDMNVAATGAGQVVELQGTGEAAPFSREEMTRLLDLAQAGIAALVEAQRAALGEVAARIGGGSRP